jgi:hypothetical protein
MTNGTCSIGIVLISRAIFGLVGSFIVSLIVILVLKSRRWLS